MPVPVLYRKQWNLTTGFNGNGLAYLLLDTFDDTRAAGLINGTYAQPGPGGKRTVTDTNSKLSIAGGVASFATGGVGAGDPGLWYPSMTRLLGRTILAVIGDNAGVNQGPLVGWDTAQVGAIADGIAFNGGATQAFVNATAISVGVATTTGTPVYKCAVVMRATGMWYFIESGTGTSEYPLWVLLYVSALGSAVMYPGVGARGSTLAIFTADNIRVPAQLFIPVPLASDGFSGANTDGLGHAEANGGGGLVWTGATWTVAAGAVTNTPTQGADVVVNGAFAADTDWGKGANWTIGAGVASLALASSTDLTATVAPLTVGVWYQTAFTTSAQTAGAVGLVVGGVVQPTHSTNATWTETQRAGTTALVVRGAANTGSVDNLSAVPLTLSTLFRSLTALVADVVADVAVTLTAGTQAGLVLNLDSAVTPANFIIAYHDGTNAHLDECVAGVYTSKINAAATYSAGAVLRVVRSGTEARLFYNNAAVGTLQTMTANTNTLHGLFSTYASNSLDNFVAWARGTNGEYKALDAF